MDAAGKQSEPFADHLPICSRHLRSFNLAWA